MRTIKVPTSRDKSTLCDVPEPVVHYIEDLLKQNGALFDRVQAMTPLASMVTNSAKDTGRPFVEGNDNPEGNYFDVNFTMTEASLDQIRDVFGLPRNLKPLTELMGESTDE